MKLSVFNVVLSQMPLAEACAYLKRSGVDAVEIGCGGYPGKAHCDPAILLQDDAKLRDFRAAVADSGLEICALSTHGNAVHPDPAVAKVFHDDFVNAVLLAEKLGITRVVTFSGCRPAKSRNSTASARVCTRVVLPGFRTSTNWTGC